MSLRLQSDLKYIDGLSQSKDDYKPKTNNDSESVFTKAEPKSYEIQKGDCLWNIVKEQYGLTSNKDIQDMVNRVVEENDIENPSIIYSGNSIILPDLYEELAQAEKEEPEKSKIDEFDEWTNSEENYEKFIEEKPVDEFEMFDFNAKTYSKDLKNFAQEYLDKYDEDNDKVMNKSEFIKMASGGEEIPKEPETQFNALYDDLFANLNLDENADYINAGEFASFLYMADLNLDEYINQLGTGNVDFSALLDAKLDYGNYQAISSITNNSTLNSMKSDWYNSFYA